MPLLVVSRMKANDSYPDVEVPYELRVRYPAMFEALDKGYKVEVRAYVDRFYNEKGDVIKEYKQLFVLPLEKIGTSYYIDFMFFHADGIPLGYFVEALLINFVLTAKDGRKGEMPIFPNEYLVKKETSLPDTVSRRVDIEKYSLERIGRDVEVIGLLYDIKLDNIATDLVEALTRFHMSDYEGAIKFFRKVVEGLRNYVQSNKLGDMSENRQELLREYLSKAYQLISNFGEHSGTHGFMPEAVLSKDIAVSSCRYVVTYLEKGRALQFYKQYTSQPEQNA